MSTTASQRALDYLEQLPGTTFTKLYQHPSTALAIFRRMLPHFAKTLVLALLYLPGSFRATDLDTWVKTDTASRRARDRSLDVLKRLRILFEKPDEAGRAGYALSPAFAKSLRLALTGGGEHGSFGVPCSTTGSEAAAAASGVGIEELDNFARRQWEGILYYVVGAANAGLGATSGQTISAGTAQLLQKGEFVAVRGRKATITQSGFTFLLQDTNAQVWTLLIVYLEVCGSLGMEAVEVLGFLFTLGSLELGVAYSPANLTPTQHQMLEDLSDFGLVYRPPSNPSTPNTPYYPTRLSTTLTSDAPALPSNTSDPNQPPNQTQQQKGYIILETNYRLYAYTTSPLQTALLSLFSTLKTRYPNLLTAKITKPSILSALALGITSNQIITYLTTHAHPILAHAQATHGTPVLPPTVVDQIRLWQLEGERMAGFPGYLIRGLEGEGEYERAVRYAEALGVLRREFKGRREFFVTRMDQMSGYFRGEAGRRKAREAGNGEG
ncbi:hypothetical protein B0A50_03883 [Salinomyces thailandicus]|uniref:RNA polymerase II transcription factor B subunit 2 n=1 Tax=Salinomyces thailandicus TaxID=706561 RepID=A0A4U0U213_9PEZI|nr:hypothetical protein B0A50_03883 [Salinomyces thailandica]